MFGFNQVDENVGYLNVVHGIPQDSSHYLASSPSPIHNAAATAIALAAGLPPDRAAIMAYAAQALGTDTVFAGLAAKKKRQQQLQQLEQQKLDEGISNLPSSIANISPLTSVATSTLDSVAIEDFGISTHTSHSPGKTDSSSIVASDVKNDRDSVTHIIKASTHFIYSIFKNIKM
ncbi:unnamed protein product [Protopolystoma xenopodis]|uniref:Uncharacterized protein n=1 Tax=Protopolystoma xenopodis TaxID=117903 RepID=A0A3S5CMJ5_9PLAT|nr:unnamed protein product [Protopolystoma xenopodis]